MEKTNDLKWSCIIFTLIERRWAEEMISMRKTNILFFLFIPIFWWKN